MNDNFQIYEAQLSLGKPKDEYTVPVAVLTFKVI